MANRLEFTPQRYPESQGHDFSPIQIIEVQNNIEAFKKAQEGTIVAVKSSDQKTVTFFYGNKKVDQTLSTERTSFDKETIKTLKAEQPTTTSELEEMSRLPVPNVSFIFHIYTFQNESIIFTEKQTNQGAGRNDIHFFSPQILIK